jgi:hypothetical protein
MLFGTMLRDAILVLCDAILVVILSLCCVMLSLFYVLQFLCCLHSIIVVSNAHFVLCDAIWTYTGAAA